MNLFLFKRWSPLWERGRKKYHKHVQYRLNFNRIQIISFFGTTLEYLLSSLYGSIKFDGISSFIRYVLYMLYFTLHFMFPILLHTMYFSYITIFFVSYFQCSTKINFLAISTICTSRAKGDGWDIFRRCVALIPMLILIRRPCKPEKERMRNLDQIDNI